MTYVAVDPANRIREHRVQVRVGIQVKGKHLTECEYGDKGSCLNGTAHEPVDEAISLAEPSARTPQCPAQGY